MQRTIWRTLTFIHVCLYRYGSPARSFEWGYQVPVGGQQGQVPGQANGGVQATADAIAAQSQDYVDENLAAFQVWTDRVKYLKS